MSTYKTHNDIKIHENPLSLTDRLKRYKRKKRKKRKCKYTIYIQIRTRIFIHILLLLKLFDVIILCLIYNYFLTHTYMHVCVSRGCNCFLVSFYCFESIIILGLQMNSRPKKKKINK